MCQHAAVLSLAEQFWAHLPSASCSLPSCLLSWMQGTILTRHCTQGQPHRNFCDMRHLGLWLHVLLMGSFTSETHCLLSCMSLHRRMPSSHTAGPHLTGHSRGMVFMHVTGAGSGSAPTAARTASTAMRCRQATS